VKSKRAAILEAATWLFSTKGYQETSTTEVARMTDSAEGTVFYHFESKEKLFLAALKDVKNRIDNAFEDFLPSTEGFSGIETLEKLVAFYLQLAADNEAQFMLLHRHHAYDLARGNEEFRALLETIYDRIVEAFENAIERGQNDGTMGELPVHKTALLVYMMIDGLVRLKNYNLYDADSLIEDFLEGVRRLVQAERLGGRSCAS
jgi:AcrR family transcriptional regulator